LINLNASSYQNDINLVPISSAAPGPGTITGSVIEGPNKASGPGDPIKDVAVHLRDASGNALEFDLTDANGDFSFDNLALDTYQLILEIVNENMSPEIISLTGSQINSNTVFEFDTLGVRVVLGFENELSIQTILYPNPAFDVMHIDFSEANIAQAEISISNLQGQILISENSENGKAQIEIENLKSGIYFIQVKSDKGQFTKKFVKQ
ncbi:MAG: T9SS type A sorting domain-containing protein, partial [Cytophagales bacterium]